MKSSTRKIVARLRDALSNEPVLRAWLFGSYARGQEDESSDIDLLVEMAPNNLTMIGFLKIQSRLEKVVSRPVDLIENSCLQDFARQSADQEKILIYEAD
ncbi:MAG: nucleotidyltransferase domain-containing protein [Bacteroidales bacterium]|nr:nucleotidyltransferase domain-containing protein [Bacteroidales bacterium]